MSRSFSILLTTFALSGLHPTTALSSPPELLFELPIGHVELWVEGQRVEGEVAKCFFKGGVLHIGNAVIDFQTRPPRTRRADQTTINHCIEYPYVQSLLLAGSTPKDAVTQYLNAQEDLRALVLKTYREEGLEPAAEILRRSPLVEQVGVGEEALAVIYRGSKIWAVTNFSGKRAKPKFASQEEQLEAQSRKFLGRIEALVKYAKHPNTLVVASRSSVINSGTNVERFTGRRADAVRRQIAFVRAGGDPDDVPHGPLKGSPYLDTLWHKD